MNNNKREIILVIVFDAIFIALGILSIFIPCIITGNWSSLASIFLFIGSFIFPLMCNAYSFQQDGILFDDEEGAYTGQSLSWLFVGIFVTIGYAIPFLLWRSKSLVLWYMICTMIGGTVVMIGSGVFFFYIFLPKRYEDLL